MHAGLIVARDPFGIKLVYYRVHAGQFSVRIQMRAVLAVTDERLRWILSR